MTNSQVIRFKGEKLKAFYKTMWPTSDTFIQHIVDQGFLQKLMPVTIDFLCIFKYPVNNFG